MTKLKDNFPALEELYRELPVVPCAACGKCCVTPHLTLLEFAYQFDTMLKNCSTETLRNDLSTPMSPSPNHTGNYRCSRQTPDGHCDVYEKRSLACRIEGMPTLEIMTLRSTPVCPNLDTRPMSEDITPEKIDVWLQRVFTLNLPFYPVSEEPYWLSALNAECWLAVLFDPSITQSLFLKIREHFTRSFCVSPVASAYIDQTGFAEKLNWIDRFFAATTCADLDESFIAIHHIIDDFPATGSYYQHEGNKYLHLLENLKKNAKKENK